MSQRFFFLEGRGREGPLCLPPSRAPLSTLVSPLLLHSTLLLTTYLHIQMHQFGYNDQSA